MTQRALPCSTRRAAPLLWPKSNLKVAELIHQFDAGGMPRGHTGIGHTRWATHGRPTVINAHPHRDCTGRIHIIHNGIIENYRELRVELVATGHEFTSDTDTEVVPHLIEQYYAGDLAAAVRAALQRHSRRVRAGGDFGRRARTHRGGALQRAAGHRPRRR